MKVRVQISTAELKNIVGHYLDEKGYGEIGMVGFEQEIIDERFPDKRTVAYAYCEDGR